MRCARHLAVTALAGVLALPGVNFAQDLGLHGYLDGRLVRAPAERSWIDGGLGKTRYGDGGTGLHFGGAALTGTAQLTPSLLALASVQWQDRGHPGMDVLEAYLRWRPVSTTRWRRSLQVGAFFPPVSLENDAIGWTSPWTLTPSAVNSWVGEELRVTGAEASLEHRGDTARWEVRGALFHRNDPAGDLLAIRGWSLSDLAFGLGSRLREPDAYVRDEDGVPPRRYDPFRRIGQHWGNYVSIEGRARGWGQLRLMHYDNRAAPSAWAPYAGGERLYAWHTRFWHLGASTDTGPVTWIAQAMDGDTTIEPIAQRVLTTHYRAAFLLAGWNRGAWRPALRLDRFSTRQPAEAGGRAGERGHAITAALNWRPRAWLRLTLEALRSASRRSDRADYGLPLRVRATQIQLSARLFY
jgi:hypothetical protein